MNALNRKVALLTIVLHLGNITDALSSTCPGDAIAQTSSCPVFSPTTKCGPLGACNKNYYTVSTSPVYSTTHELVGPCLDPFNTSYNVNYKKYVLQSGTSCSGPIFGQCNYLVYNLSITCNTTGCTDWCP
jgi:hypothetical protein